MKTLVVFTGGPADGTRRALEYVGKTIRLPVFSQRPADFSLRSNDRPIEPDLKIALYEVIEAESWRDGIDRPDERKALAAFRGYE